MTTYTQDTFGTLTSVSLPTGQLITYILDGASRRIGKKVNGLQTQGFLYRNGSQIVAELDRSNNVVTRFVYASRMNMPDYMIKGGITYRIISDYLGSPPLVVDLTAERLCSKMDYDEWGNVT